MHTEFVLDALEQALWARQPGRDTLIHHSDRGSQYVSIRYSERLAEAGIEPSVGSTGDSYDNALAETINGLYKEESGGGGAGDAGMGGVVQSPPLAGADWLHSTGGGRSKLLSQSERAGRAGLTHTKQPPRNPGRLNSITSKLFTIEPAATATWAASASRPLSGSRCDADSGAADHLCRRTLTV